MTAQLEPIPEPSPGQTWEEFVETSQESSNAIHELVIALFGLQGETSEELMAEGRDHPGGLIALLATRNRELEARVALLESRISTPALRRPPR